MELLVPAGNPEKLRFALHYGADAVYAGGERFSLRTRADNFTIGEIGEGIRSARSLGKKFYLAVNAVVREAELAALRDYLKAVIPLAPDALIVSDPGVLCMVRKISPDIPVHISTQANTSNSAAFSLYRDLGVSRVVLARELSLDDIRAVREAAPDMELEVFAHGAMCVAYSGRCLLSHYLTHPAFLSPGEEADPTVTRPRSANRGDCSHTCRWEFSLAETRRDGIVLDAEPLAGETLLFSSKDLCLIGHLQDLAGAGVDSVKIEGRMKSVLYTAVTARAYRAALDLGRVPEDREMDKWTAELASVSNREYTTGFLFGGNGAHVSGTVNRTALATFLGVVEKKVPGGYLCRSRNRIDPDTPMTAIGPGMREIRGFSCTLKGPDGENVDFIRHSSPFILETEAGLEPMDILRSN